MEEYGSLTECGGRVSVIVGVMRMRLMKMTVVAWVVCGAIAVAQQERGSWRAVSNTARSITGDVALADERISINFTNFTIARVRALDQKELSALFETEGGSGSLYRMDVPAAKRFVKKNTLCGDSDVQWMATYVEGKELRLAFFSGGKAPVITAENLANTTDLCGTYTYAR
jgi:hypothetical protein